MATSVISSKPNSISSHFLKLLDIFPQVCPLYLKKISTGVAADEQGLHDLISKILDEENPPLRNTIASSRRQSHVENQLEILHQLLPDADPTFLQKQNQLYSHDSDTFREFVNDAIEKKNYPTKQEFLRKLELSTQKKQYTTKFSIDKFLSIFPDPEAYFTDPKRKPVAWGSSAEYVMCVLRNHFDRIYIRTINSSICQYGEDLVKIADVLEKEINENNTMKSKRKPVRLPAGTVDIPLLQEIAYIEHKKEIKYYISNIRKEQEEAKAYAKRHNLLKTCCCCFDDEITPKDVVLCPRSCHFCKSCVQKSVEVAFGLGKLNFHCLTNCGVEFSLHTLESVLEPKFFSKIASKKQVAEVKAAGIDDLEECPFCDFLTIPAEGDKLFRCLNPECMKDSCRRCKEPSHLPLPCGGIEEDELVKQRRYMENKMTEALMRKCDKCGLAFIKEIGCNKMTCTCGNIMCYVCRKSILDYRHFYETSNKSTQDFLPKNGLCPLFTDTIALHKENIQKSIDAAKTELGLRNDPTKFLDIENYYNSPSTA